MKRTILTAVLSVALVGQAYAKVEDSTPQGFTVRHELDIKAPASAVYAAFLNPSAWWNPQHSWSGDAKNLTIEPKAGGCFCEALPDGGMVEHMRVVFVQPYKALNLFGGLGPLQSTGASGYMNMKLTEKDGVTHFTLTYSVGGYAKGGLEKWASPVDFVLGEQAGRFKAVLEKPKP